MSTVLGTDKEKLSSNADFFELGGSSLDTISLISSIESKIGIQSKLRFYRVYATPHLCVLNSN